MSVQPVVLINAATSTVTSPTLDLLDVYANISASIVVSGATSSDQVVINGSLDGTNWYELCLLNFSGAGVYKAYTSADTATGTGASPGMLARYVQAVLVYGTGTGTVTVTLAAKLWRRAGSWSRRR